MISLKCGSLHSQQLDKEIALQNVKWTLENAWWLSLLFVIPYNLPMEQRYCLNSAFNSPRINWMKPATGGAPMVVAQTLHAGHIKIWTASEFFSILNKFPLVCTFYGSLCSNGTGTEYMCPDPNGNGATRTLDLLCQKVRVGQYYTCPPTKQKPYLSIAFNDLIKKYRNFSWHQSNLSMTWAPHRWDNPKIMYSFKQPYVNYKRSTLNCAFLTTHMKIVLSTGFSKQSNFFS